MRLRALPPSFWQQPNQPNPFPGAMYLPPLFKNDLEGIDGNVDVHFEEARLLGLETASNTINRDVKISPANTELLFKLFENVEQREKKQQQFLQQKSLKSKAKPGMSSKALIKGGEDPCIVDAVSEGLFPLLTLDTRNETVQYLAFKTNNGETTATTTAAYANLSSNGLSNSSPMISSTSTANTLLTSTATGSNGLPLLQYEQNYSQALSEVVAAL